MKVALLADLHFGVKKSNQVFQDSQLKFFKEQFVPELKEKKIDTIIVCGDIFDTRQSVNVQTENVVLHLFKDILKDFNIHIIVGNHDLYCASTTEINSLKALDLLSNITVYEKPTKIKLDNQDIMMLPWITNYNEYDTMALEPSTYCFAHLDVISFQMDKYNISDHGLTINQLFRKFNHIYTGHYHERSRKETLENSLTYIGAPYQITRIDRDKERGYIVLDLDNNDFEWCDNKVSMKFLEFIYPNYDKNNITGNVIDLIIPYPLQNETKKIYDMVQEIDKLNPAYPTNTEYAKKPEDEESELDIDTSQFNLITLFKTYIDQLETTLNKTELYNELVTLYNTFKGAE